jgi:hypothetical protein
MVDRLIPTNEPAIWIIPSLGMEGNTNIGDDTAFNKALTVYGAEGEVGFLESVKDLATTYNPLPDSGWIEAGHLYSYESRLVICRQSHYRTIYPPEQTPALFAVYRVDADDVLDWIANENVVVGTKRKYLDKVYQCLQAHMTLENWTPPATPALWQEVVETPIEYLPWKQPTGAHDAYNIGDKVTFNGHLWESLINANVWSPTVYPAGWKDLGVYP